MHLRTPPSAPVGPPPPTRRALLIEGWRGVNHSFAMANQHQILELLAMDGVRLFHRDMPFAFAHWDRAVNKAGFSQDDQRRIDDVPDPLDSPVDCIHRIVAPFRAPAASERVRTVTFMITELGLSAASFAPRSERSDAFTRDGNEIVTSTRWSRDRIVEYGFAADKVKVIPLGVDSIAFTPPETTERRDNRLRLGFCDDETVFLNIGVAVWNKGIDVLLTAFARLRGRGRRVRLILKDQRDLYGISVERTVKILGQSVAELRDPATLAAISVIPGNLDRAQLRALYGLADCYVSPYRAEGFNLPVIEAIACGTPVIVTRGGATDDFCDDDLACRIQGRLAEHRSDEERYVGRYIEPDADDLVSAMDRFAVGAGINMRNFARARALMLPRFTWRRSAAALAALTLGVADADPPRIVGAAPASAARTVRQRDLLDLLSIIRPVEMTSGSKVRIGGPCDGGYVAPSVALTCDAVLSVGIGNDVSFDLHLAERGARVLQFDHTVARSPAAHPNFVFHKLGWGAATAGDLLAFPQLREKLDAVGGERTLLKFDIEGAEYAVLDALDAGDLAPFAVIVCELHHLSRLCEPDFFDTARRCLAKLTLHHAPVHLHPNNYGRLALLEGVPVPDVMELSFLRRDLGVSSQPCRDPIPGKLDRPNHPLGPDFCLTAFLADHGAVTSHRSDEARVPESA
jgi:glycosyltransferase involved in cell wall biosynthesis